MRRLFSGRFLEDMPLGLDHINPLRNWATSRHWLSRFSVQLIDRSANRPLTGRPDLSNNSAMRPLLMTTEDHRRQNETSQGRLQEIAYFCFRACWLPSVCLHAFVFYL
jgi:hypothetical protein